MREKSDQKIKSKDPTLFYILLIIGSYAIIFLAILYFGKDYFILLYKNDKQFNVVWDYIYEDKYEEAKVALKEYDTSVPIEARRAQITNDFCDICIKYREKEYYDILRFLDVYYTSNNDQFYYDFKDEKIQNYFDNKMREINQYLEANEGDIYYAHGLLVREETMRRLAEGYEEYNYTGAPSKYKEKNRYDGLSSKKNKNYKEKDPSDYDIDGYYWDYKDEFYDEDDAWDDFEDNDAWDDY